METRNIQSSNSPESRKAGDPLELTLYGVKAIFRYCPPGTFIMGSPVDEKGRDYVETPHEVTLTKGFWLLETPVTQALWVAVTGENPSLFQGMDARPVEEVSWHDCNNFVRKLNNAKVAPNRMKFDFPTEAEWEYACRAGTTSRFNCGDELTESDANFDYEFGAPSPVKSFAPNAWGFYDMHGNVWEWCSDWYGFFPSTSCVDPHGPNSGLNRVQRGGGWDDCAKDCRSANRFGNAPSRRRNYFGFRLALRSLNKRSVSDRRVRQLYFI